MPDPVGDGPALTIRRASPKDAAALTQLMSEPAVFGGLLQLPYPSEERWHAVLSEAVGPGKGELSLVALQGGTVVGSAGLTSAGTALRRRHAMGIGLMVARKAQRQGVGSALMAAVCDYADRWLGLLRLELTVFADNEVAQRLYRRFGFEVEGRFRGYAMRDGVYVDAVSMARFHPTPPRIAPAADRD